MKGNVRAVWVWSMAAAIIAVSVLGASDSCAAQAPPIDRDVSRAERHQTEIRARERAAARRPGPAVGAASSRFPAGSVVSRNGELALNYRYAP